MNALNIVAFVAEIDGFRYRVKMAGPSVLSADKAPARMSEMLELECRQIAFTMNEDPGLRHCDQGFACAKSLKDRYGAKIWECEFSHHPADAIF